MRLASRLAIVPFAALFLDGMAVPPDFMERNERGSLRAQLYYQAGTSQTIVKATSDS